MADNVTTQTTTLATIPSGTKISTDEDATNGHVQRVKLAISADGASTHIPADATDGLLVNLGANNDVVGNVADDAADAGNPVKVGAKAKAFDGTDPGSASAENDRVDLTADLNRRLYVNPHHANHWRANNNDATAQTNKALKTAPGAGLSLYLQTLIISIGPTAGNVKLVEDTAGTPVDIAGPYYFAANGGIAVNFEPPLRLTANKNLGFTSVTVTNHTVTLSGFIAP